MCFATPRAPTATYSSTCFVANGKAALSVIRSHPVESTRSHQNSVVKLRWARVVPTCVNCWEHLVMDCFCTAFQRSTYERGQCFGCMLCVLSIKSVVLPGLWSPVSGLPSLSMAAPWLHLERSQPLQVPPPRWLHVATYRSAQLVSPRVHALPLQPLCNFSPYCSVYACKLGCPTQPLTRWTAAPQACDAETCFC
jgi:hypothetical protein